MGLGGYAAGGEEVSNSLKPGKTHIRYYGEEYINPVKAVSSSQKAMRDINPDAYITTIWKGDNWPPEGNHLYIDFCHPEIHIYREEDNSGAESFVEFSDGHLIVVRTDEQARTAAPPVFGKARRGTGTNHSKPTRKSKGGKRR